MSKDALREAAFRSSNRRSKIVEVDFDGSGIKHRILIREPNMGVRQKILETVGCSPTPASISAGTRAAVIACAYDPDGDVEPVFNDRTDSFAMAGQYIWVESLGKQIFDFIKQCSTEAHAEEVEKNSAATPSVS